MKLPGDRVALIEALAGGLEVEWLFFWGHTPKGEGLGPWVFSQWWEGHPFVVDEERFVTAEHWMMAGKARLMGDEATRAEILAAESPGAAKALGRKVTPFDPERWDAHKRALVAEGNVEKFGQHPELARYLASTAGKVLVEASPRDRIWGIGLGAKNEAARDPNRWRGQNLLGFALMAARETLAERDA